ncbi:MAG: hypothetical protein IT481_09020 [Gammaproteobacteria bacterium]|nr:hypothetical protein [Gammaproteobacteria bacterium]
MTDGSATTTGRRSGDAGTRGLARWLHGVLAIGLIASLAACAAVPDNGIAERLDERTGTTVTAMQRAIELVSTEPRGGSGDPFAYLAPFETNRMGRRELYLWVAVPDERGGAAMPVVVVGSGPLPAKPLGADAGSLGLGSFPYPTPAPWSKISVFSIDEAALRSLAAAGALEVSVRYADGRVVRFGGTPQPADILRQFLGSLGL